MALRARRTHPIGQVLVLFVLLLPVIVGLVVFISVLVSLYGAQEQAAYAARSTALAGLSTINAATGPVTDSGVTAKVTGVLRNRPYAQVVYTTSVAAPTGGVIDVTGVYSPSGAILGANAATNLAGTTTITTTVTLGVGMAWGTLGARTFSVRASAVATNCATTIAVNAPCAGP